LEQPELEQYFVTRNNVELSGICKAYGLNYQVYDFKNPNPEDGQVFEVLAQDWKPGMKNLRKHFEDLVIIKGVNALRH
jgi:hypothetical protein